MKETEEERSLLREQRDQFLDERNTARQLLIDLAASIESAHRYWGGWIPYPADLMARVALMKGESSYEFPVRERFTEDSAS